MKTMKKVIALVLSIVAVTMLLALPVSAATAETEDVLRYPILLCVECGVGTMRIVYHHDATDDDLETYDLYQCDTCHATMKHVTSVG